MDNETKRLFRTLGYISTTGLAMAFSIGIGAVAGHYLDEKLGTHPWLFFILLGCGIAAAFKNLYVMYRKVKNLQ
ncbi:MAG: AtpZ/AtpI family protein [Deltaproteobacteria bacterium]|nr:AtpZ/AtpI family protein [Deltaproteobacteria bacterium]MBW2137621.1 AtpZ/AtpI family protein [Deltaproteobacteria bacterium]